MLDTCKSRYAGMDHRRSFFSFIFTSFPLTFVCYYLKMRSKQHVKTQIVYSPWDLNVCIKPLKRAFETLAEASAVHMSRLQYSNVVGFSEPRNTCAPETGETSGLGILLRSTESRCITGQRQSKNCGWEKQPQTKHLSKQTEKRGGEENPCKSC